ncbi:MAG: hypothetical protein OEV42_20080 [Deltaproteobacteria bacterium]|nr:hypothetical protein [Deltaproteobacteria bacterium]
MEYNWSKKEKKIARQAFDRAYEREMRHLAEKVRKMLDDNEDARAVWRILDMLREEARETDFKYDYRYSVLILIFARLLREGWLMLEDLEGISEEKIEKIREVANIKF